MSKHRHMNNGAIEDRVAVGPPLASHGHRSLLYRLGRQARLRLGTNFLDKVGPAQIPQPKRAPTLQL